ncbi:MAG TPA: ABC transporter permease [Candidatus Binataceae bacterium]|nr:ABC transporter permease [Candidatus Binataceae bacterium]
MAAAEANITKELLSFSRIDADTLVVRLAGAWRLRRGMPSIDAVAREFAAPTPPHKVVFEASGLSHWDSSLVSFVVRLNELCRERRVAADLAGLPAGLQRIVTLAETVPETKARGAAGDGGLLERLGLWLVGALEGAGEFLDFLGEIAVAAGKLMRGRARYRRSDLLDVIQQCGASALGIVTLISFLVGMILAFMGAVQLQQFGAAIYVADLVGIGMVREMGAMMTGIIMAGRTGAAFAAELGTMKVTEELDAFATMGISSIEFLVLPRVIALVLMMPMLCLYADFVGVLGGAAVGYTMLGLSIPTYLRETFHAVTLTQLVGGLSKSVVYGILIAYAGCLRGFQCGNSSSAVGDAATDAVVTGIVAIVVSCGIFAVIFNVLGI